MEEGPVGGRTKWRYDVFCVFFKTYIEHKVRGLKLTANQKRQARCCVKRFTWFQFEMGKESICICVSETVQCLN